MICKQNQLFIILAVLRRSVGLVDNDIATDAGGPGFDSRAGQIGPSVADNAAIDPATRYTLRRNTVSMMKIWLFRSVKLTFWLPSILGNVERTLLYSLMPVKSGFQSYFGCPSYNSPIVWKHSPVCLIAAVSGAATENRRAKMNTRRQ